MEILEPQLFEGGNIQVLDAGVYAGEFPVSDSNISYETTGEAFLGYGYVSKVGFLPSALPVDGKSIYGEQKRISGITPYLLNTKDLELIVMENEGLEATRSFLDTKEVPVTGFKKIGAMGAYSLDTFLYLSQPRPYSGCILSVIIKIDD